MGRITSSVGLISGIDTGSIINSLIAIDSQPITDLQNQVTTATAQQAAFTDLGNQISSLKTVSDALGQATTFQPVTANSSDTSVLTATATNGASLGSYQFQVAQLVSTQQTVTNGYANPDQTKLNAGTITLDLGGGQVTRPTDLSQLNGGNGVSSGEFRITDRAGQSDIINISNALTLNDVVQDINTAPDISVKASIGATGLVITDTSGVTGTSAASLTIADVGGGTAAQSLGIAGNSDGTNLLTGSNINSIGLNTAVSQLNDGRGIDTSTTGSDFTIQAGDGSTYAVSLAGQSTVGDIINAINTATGGDVTASINAAGNGLELTDNSVGGGGGSLAVLPGGSNAAAELGLTQPATGNIIVGGPVIASLGSVLISTLNGGSGLPLGQISITNRAGDAQTVDLSNANSLQDILNDINSAFTDSSGNQTLTASINAAGNGIAITDQSGGTGDLTISDVNSTTAAALGIAGTYDTSTATVEGANLHPQYVSGNTLLSAYNGGKGVDLGSFQITTASGGSATIDISNAVTLGDVINDINARGIGVTAGINSQGNGLLLTDNTAGTGTLTVNEVGGTTASDLNILGSATAGANTIDGALEKTIDVTANDTLSSLATKINNLGFGVSASIINDGSSVNPYRLSLSALNSGTAGQVVIDTGTTGLSTTNLVNAQNAAVFVGQAGSGNPLLVTSSTNQITDIIPGVTLNLQGTSSTPVTLGIASDPSSIETQINQFITDFNGIVTQLNTLTSYNTTTQTAGLLLGDPTAQEIQTDLYTAFNSSFSGGSAGDLQTLADVGITLNSDGTASFNQSVFEAAYGKNPQSVTNLFTTAKTGLANIMSTSLNSLIDPTSGVIPLENNTITTQNQQFQDQISVLNQVIAQKKDLLTQQFNNMEQVLAGLQSQQQELNGLVTSLNSINSASSSSSASSTSSNSSSNAASGSPGVAGSSTSSGS